MIHHDPETFPISETADMDSQTRSPRLYAAPRLKIYGDSRELTRSATTIQTNKNDATQGQNNLKT